MSSAALSHLDAPGALRMLKANGRAYTHFVIVAAFDGSGAKVDSGWEYAEDARDRAGEAREENADSGVTVKVYTRATVARAASAPELAKARKGKN